MDKDKILKLLNQVKDKKLSVERAYSKLKTLPYEDMKFAKIDHHRTMRKGFPEVIFCQGKSIEHIAKIAFRIFKKQGSLLATRAGKEAFKAVKKLVPSASYNETARIISSGRSESGLSKKNAKIAVMTAGTADIPAAEEAAATAEFLGNKVVRLFDVGVAGIHRLFDNIDILYGASVIIVAAGMEGALASVVAGLVDCPVIALPTSVGYGASFEGLAALLSMLNCCAPGVAVVNIDNGFGAGCMASIILGSKDKK
jgi:NCAIR mutase (PurE)-related protein